MSASASGGIDFGVGSSSVEISAEVSQSIMKSATKSISQSKVTTTEASCNYMPGVLTGIYQWRL